MGILHDVDPKIMTLRAYVLGMENRCLRLLAEHASWLNETTRDAVQGVARTLHATVLPVAEITDADRVEIRALLKLVQLSTDWEELEEENPEIRHDLHSIWDDAYMAGHEFGWDLGNVNEGDEKLHAQLIAEFGERK